MIYFIHTLKKIVKHFSSILNEFHISGVFFQFLYYKVWGHPWTSINGPRLKKGDNNSRYIKIYYKKTDMKGYRAISKICDIHAVPEYDVEKHDPCEPEPRVQQQASAATTDESGQ